MKLFELNKYKKFKTVLKIKCENTNLGTYLFKVCLFLDYYQLSQMTLVN